MQTFSFFSHSKRFTLDLAKVSVLRRGIGLMFRSRATENLLFDFQKPSRVAITSWFVFFPFVAVWLDKRRRIVEARIVYPFTARVVPRFPSSYLIELPLNRRNSRITRFLVGK